MQHIFLQTSVAPPTQRWLEAFPQGRVLGLASALDAMHGLSGKQYLVWLSSLDPQWSEHIRALQKAQAHVPIALVSNEPQEAEGLAALEAGVRAYTHAHAVPALLQEVALVVEHGGLWVGEELMQRMVAATHRALVGKPRPAAVLAVPNAWELLSAREAQVAHAVALGQSNKEIAASMFISERTVKAHLGAVFVKLGVRDRLQLVVRLAASPQPESVRGDSL